MPKMPASSDSDDDVPLNQRSKPAAAAAPPAEVKAEPGSSKKRKPKKGEVVGVEQPQKRNKASPKPAAPSAPSAKKKAPVPVRGTKSGAAHLLELDEDESGDGTMRAWWDEESDDDDDEANGIKWRTLEHKGVLFPPAYAPHKKKLLYGPNKESIQLSQEAEEVATFYAQMLNTEYVKKEAFNQNFFRDFLKVLNSDRRPEDPPHKVQDFAQCDFSRMVEWVESEKERKKLIPAEEKKKIRELKEEHDAPYRFAKVGGYKEKLGNFMVEPPGLFRGRGEHPKMGTLKHRVTAEQISLNLGTEASVPVCPMPGHEWGEIIHNSEVTWLAYWKENVSLSTKCARRPGLSC